MLGFLTANLVGRNFVEFGENLLNRMPIVRPIYKTMKQIFETLFSKSGSSFRKVALAEFPDRHVVGGVRRLSRPARTSRRVCRASEYVSCFLPCTPNPTTGFFFYVPRDKVIELDITVEAGDDADHVGRHGAAQQRRRAEEACRPDRERPRGPHRHCASCASDHASEREVK